MIHLLNDQQLERYSTFKQFVDKYVSPFAEEWEHEQRIPHNVLKQCGKAGFIGGILPQQYGGGEWDNITFGLLNEAFGRASSSLTGLFTVQAMVAVCILKWGTSAQKNQWLPRISAGEQIASFALTEPAGGSNIQFIETSFSLQDDDMVINGQKKWITFSEYADIFLVFGKLNGQLPVACIVERNTPGIHIEPIKDMMGFRASHLSEITFQNCRVPQWNVIGRPGFGLSCVANLGLHYGRISTAWSAAGLMRACVEESIAYSKKRMIGKKLLHSLESVKSVIADMCTRQEAVSLLCWQASYLEDKHSPQAIEKAIMAKLMASVEAVQASGNAVQMQGAAGCRENTRVARCYRDSKIMEIIEGTTQVCKNALGDTLL
ncbi:hypothetical protein A3860_05160 [Niastella vici]|uniref:Acyl-CoA dehydrogenase n=1 Tax=Niastella vici TaxID=1703345 RepID=A0A1V9FS08_9BACT|nr:acyl-CoA dehydrogenase family protein [Niastella vici]OQP61108.1 hypothetical protein A3860_05160 [Niastella vici]